MEDESVGDRGPDLVPQPLRETKPDSVLHVASHLLFEGVGGLGGGEVVMYSAYGAGNRRAWCADNESHPIDATPSQTCALANIPPPPLLATHVEHSRPHPFETAGRCRSFLKTPSGSRPPAVRRRKSNWKVRTPQHPRRIPCAHKKKGTLREWLFRVALKRAPSTNGLSPTSRTSRWPRSVSPFSATTKVVW